MDNHYVPNLTIGPMVCSALRKHGVTAPIDVHLMVSPVDRIVGDFGLIADWVNRMQLNQIYRDNLLAALEDAFEVELNKGLVRVRTPELVEEPQGLDSKSIRHDRNARS